MRKYLLLALALITPACIHSSDESVIESYKDNVQVVNSQLNYEEAYSIVSKQYKACNRRSTGPNEDIVESNLDNQKQVGRIAQSIKAPFLSPNYIIVIDIKPSGSGSTLYVYSRNGALDPDVAKWTNKWINGERGCWM